MEVLFLRIIFILIKKTNKQTDKNIPKATVVPKMDPKAHEEAASPDGATGRGPRSGLDRVPPAGRPAGHAAACTWSRRG